MARGSRSPRSRSPRGRDRRSRTRSAEKARQPCVFYFSKEAKGCKFSHRECKFSHDKVDYESWNDDGRILPNTGLIHRDTPVNGRDGGRDGGGGGRGGGRGRRSYTRSPTRSPLRQAPPPPRSSVSPDRSDKQRKRGRERSFTLSPVRTGGYQPQGFSRAQRGFVNHPPGTVDKFLVDTRDLKQRSISRSQTPRRKSLSPNPPAPSPAVSQKVTSSASRLRKSPKSSSQRSSRRSSIKRGSSSIKSSRKRRDKSSPDSRKSSPSPVKVPVTSKKSSKLSKPTKKSKKSSKPRRSAKSESDTVDSDSSSSSSSSSESEVETKKKKKRKKSAVASYHTGVIFEQFERHYTFKDALKDQRSEDLASGLTRVLNGDMSISKTRQFSLQLNPRSGQDAIFAHVDCSKLPQDPESRIKSETSVGGGNLLAAMFGTADEDEDDLNGDTPEPEQLVRRKAELAKREKPRGTTGIPICSRITWWQETHRNVKSAAEPVSASPQPVKKVTRKTRKAPRKSPSPKKARKRASSSSRSPSPVRKPKSKRQVKRSMSPGGRVIVHDDRQNGHRVHQQQSSPPPPPARQQSSSTSRRRHSPSPSPPPPSPPRRRRSRSRTRSAPPSDDDARKPCVFYFSKTATGCRFNARECKFSHDKYDYKEWENRGKELPNQGLIERTRPVRPRSRSPRRSSGGGGRY